MPRSAISLFKGWEKIQRSGQEPRFIKFKYKLIPRYRLPFYMSRNGRGANKW